ncbi:MAG: hypothetical protein HQL47_02335 [Gammaproteobacteria bacterium]|nr:hypothetical protein [Gammaproteobacteria bacterium]
MDQDAFRKTYQEVNECFCVYEKAILLNRCHCALADRFCIAEREGVECQTAPAQEQCFEFLETLRENARFALKARSELYPLPHGKAMRLQMGGLRGLHRLRYPSEQTPVLIANVHDLLSGLVADYGSIEALPYNRIIQQVAEYREPKRSTRRQRDKGQPEED